MRKIEKLAFGSAGIALLAFTRIAYVRHSQVHSPEQALGVTLEPINFACLILLCLSAAATVLLAICAVILRFAKPEEKA